MVLLLRMLAGFVAHLPLPWALALGRGLGWVYGSVIRYHREDALEAVARSFPEKSEREVREIVEEMYAHTGMNMAEFLRVLGGRVQEVYDRVDVEGMEHMEEALARKKGVLALVSHCGNWEYLAMVMAKHFQPSGLIIKELRNQKMNEYFARNRASMNMLVFERRGAARPIMRGLKKDNLLVGFVLDQNMIRTEGVFADFFGKPACTSPGLAQMSASTGAPVVPIFMVRENNGRHTLKISPLLEPPLERTAEAIEKATQDYTRRIEDAVRGNPEQWIWMHRRWKTVPAGEGSTQEVKDL